MNDIYGITYSNLVSVFPDNLREDEKVNALVRATSEALVKHIDNLSDVNIYCRTDKLPEGVLDIIADDFGIDWYESDADLESKRSMIKNSFTVQRHIGTKSAVQLVLDSLYENATVQEWFEYNGEPYHYKIRISQGDKVTTGSNDEQIEKLKAGLIHYANFRSVLDSVIFVGSVTSKVYSGAQLYRRHKVRLEANE